MQDILVYINGELLLTFNAPIKFKPEKYGMRTQTDRSTATYLNSEMRYGRFQSTELDFCFYSLFLPNGVMGYKKVQSTRSSDFVQEMIAPHLSSYIEFYQVNETYKLMKQA